MTPLLSPEEQRQEFEADAAPMGFDLTRQSIAVPEPWAEYADENTGHRWAGWLAAATRSRPVQEPVAWMKTHYSRIGGHSFTDDPANVKEWAKQGVTLTPLYAAPLPAVAAPLPEQPQDSGSFHLVAGASSGAEPGKV